MKIAITGCSGHIGSYIVFDLAKKYPDAELILVDKIIDDNYFDRLAIKRNCNHKICKADILHDNILPFLENANIVIHLAAIIDKKNLREDQGIMFEDNVECTSIIAKACVQTGSRMIALSTTSVYGTNKDEVAEEFFSEDIKPQNQYALSKIREEGIIKDLCLNEGLRATVYRFASVFGVSPNMKFHTTVNKFCKQAVLSQPVTVWRTAFEQKRPYLDIIDASNAVSFLIDNDIFDGNIFNVSTNTFTIHNIVNTIKKYIPNIRISFIDEPIMNEWSYGVSCGRLIDSGFVFTGDLERGIRDTIEYLHLTNQIKA